MNAALAVILAFLALAIGLALRARRGRDMDLEQWTVGGRGFGTLFVFLLMAGEIYSTFTFLGGAGHNVPFFNYLSDVTDPASLSARACPRRGPTSPNRRRPTAAPYTSEPPSWHGRSAR